MGFFLLVFVISLADYFVLLNKHYYYSNVPNSSYKLILVKMRAEYGRFFGGTAAVVWARIRANSSCCVFFDFVIWCMFRALLTLLRSSSLCLLRIDKMQAESRMCGRCTGDFSQMPVYTGVPV